VVTAAHVVAGQQDTVVQAPGGGRLRADAVRYDPRNDLALLRVPGLGSPPLALGDDAGGETVAILGYPRGGRLTAAAGRTGAAVAVLAPDAYGRGPVRRSVTTVRGKIERGNSGGPAVNARGEVETTVFAARVGDGAGFGVPPSIVRRALAAARGPVSTGPCAR
jgi:S1-C subfamily serine protease